MLAATLLVLVASGAPTPDYRQLDLTEEDHHNIALVCDSTHWSRSSRADCLKQKTEKLRRQKQDQVDAREAEARTARQTAR